MVNIPKKGYVLHKNQNILGTSFHISPKKCFYAHISSLKNCSYHIFSEVRELFFSRMLLQYITKYQGHLQKHLSKKGRGASTHIKERNKSLML